MVSALAKPRFELELWRSRGEYNSLLGHQIFYVDSGEGHSFHSNSFTELLLHGFPTSCWDWRPLWGELADGCRVIALDMLGFGFSDKPNNRKYSIHG